MHKRHGSTSNHEGRQVARRVINSALSVILTVGLMPSMAWASTNGGGDANGNAMTAESTLTASANSAFSGGSGTKADPYQISTATDLTQLASDVNGGNSYAGYYFKLTADITAASGFSGIGTSASTPFSGTIDGDGNTLELAISGSTSQSSVALFPYASNATIENLTVTGSVSTSENANNTVPRYAAGIVGYVGGENSDTTLTIKNCKNSCTVSAKYSGSTTATSGTEAPHYAGGMLAYAYTTGAVVIANCINANTITAFENYQWCGNKFTVAGGIVGYSDANLTISNCYNIGAIVSKNLANSMLDDGSVIAAVGGEILGFHAKGTESTPVSISNCYAGAADSSLSVDSAQTSSSIKFTAQLQGGVCGAGISGGAQYVKYDNCYWLEGLDDGTGSGLLASKPYLHTPVEDSIDVSAKTVDYTGASSCTATNCPTKTNSSKNSRTEGNLTTAQLKASSMVATLNGEQSPSMWVADANNINSGYPILQWEDPVDISSNASVSVPGATTAAGVTTFVYTDTVPSVVVTVDGTTLTEWEDYTVTYTDADGNTVSADSLTNGTYTATITGKGNYTGTTTTTFTVKDNTKLDNAAIATIGTQEYSGAAVTPTVTVTDAAGNVLKEGTDYTVEYSDNTGVGTGKVTIKPATGSSYTGSQEVTFSITETLSTENVTVSDVMKSDTATEPTITVKDVNGNTLEKGTNYTVTYYSGTDTSGTPIEASQLTTAGTYTAVITGVSPYTGTVTETFQVIDPKDLGNASANVSNTTYTGGVVTPTITVTDAAGNTVDSSKYTVTYYAGTDTSGEPISAEDIDDVGKYTVVITAADGSGYTGSLTKTFEVVGSTDLQYAKASVSGTEYTGSAITPTITVYAADGTTLTEGTDYTVTYYSDEACTTEVAAADLKNAGKYYAVIEGTGNYTGTVTKTFTVNPIDASGATVTVPESSYTYTGSTIEPTITVTLADGTVVDPSNYDVTYENNTGTSYAWTTATAKVTFKGNYTGTASTTYTITPTMTLKGSGTEDDPYLVSSAAELQYFANSVKNGDTYEGKYVKLTSDLDMSETTFAGIGDSTHPFSGNFDGAGHTVDVNINSTDKYAGFFPYVVGDSAAIKNLTVTGSISTTVANASEDACAGGIVGYSYAKSTDYPTIENCTSKCAVSAVGEGNAYAGGIIGYANAADDGSFISIYKCVNTGNVSATSKSTDSSMKSAAGGIVGIARKITLDNSYNRGTITAVETGSALSYAGGLLGYIDQKSRQTPSNISNSYSAATIDADTQKGGLCGFCNYYTTPFDTCYWLEGQDLAAVGNDGGSTADASEVTATQLQADDMVTTLNASQGLGEKPWLSDTTGVNDGYPVLRAYYAYLSDATIAPIEDQKFASGDTEVEPKLTVTDVLGNVLVEGTDYTVEYSDNTGVGTGTATITGIGDYTGTNSATFTIRQAYIVSTTSLLMSNDEETIIGESVATIGGGGKYFENGEVKLTVGMPSSESASNVTFKGWYTKSNGTISSEPVSTSAAYSFTATADVNLVAVYASNETTTANLTLKNEGSATSGQYKVTVSAPTEKTHESTGEVATFECNTGVAKATLSYTQSEKKTIYWVDESRHVVGTGETLDLTIIGNRTLIAACCDNIDDQVNTMVSFRSYYQQVVLSENVLQSSEENASSSITIPSVPSKIGYTDGKWKFNGTVYDDAASLQSAIQTYVNQYGTNNMLLKVTPTYTKDDTKATIRVYKDDALSETLEGLDVGKSVTLTAPDAEEGKYFAGWKIYLSDKTEPTNYVSMSKTYEYTPATSSTPYIAKACYTDSEPTAVATTELIETSKTAGSPKNAYTVIMGYDVPQGCTFVECGIYCGSTQEKLDANKTHYQSNTKSAAGQIKVTINTSADQLYVKSYVTYIDESGATTTIYSTNVAIS